MAVHGHYDSEMLLEHSPLLTMFSVFSLLFCFYRACVGLPPHNHMTLEHRVDTEVKRRQAAEVPAVVPLAAGATVTSMKRLANGEAVTNGHSPANGHGRSNGHSNGLTNGHAATNGHTEPAAKMPRVH